jgi:hypothetical protein
MRFLSRRQKTVFDTKGAKDTKHSKKKDLVRSAQASKAYVSFVSLAFFVTNTVFPPAARA